MQRSPIRNIDGNWTRMNHEKAYRYADHLERIFHPNETRDAMLLPENVEQE